VSCKLEKFEKVKLRLEMVKMARKEGITKSARFFNTTRKTVRKWLNRWKENGIKGLEDKSKEPHFKPQKLSEEKIKTF